MFYKLNSSCLYNFHTSFYVRFRKSMSTESYVQCVYICLIFTIIIHDNNNTM